MTQAASKLQPMVLRNVAAKGEAGAAWLATLPTLVADLERRWNVVVGATMPNATEAYVAETMSANGHAGVLKLPIPDAEKPRRELGVLLAANGRGYVRVLEHDPASGAMLLERLGPQLAQLGYPIERQIEVICATLAEAWRQPPADLSLMTGAEKAASLANAIRAIAPRFEAACSARTIDVALRFAEQRGAAFDPSTSVLGHGDSHCWNTLVDPAGGGFKFVDPEGLFIEPAHDLSISLREWSDDFLSGDPVSRGLARCEILARLTGVEATPIWQWGVLETLVNGLLFLDVGSPIDAAPYLAVAAAWANAEP
ncbi:MAG TPA: aminoglycoside phosphotransferase family protein [Caulobacteraceae bacterium]